MQKKIFEISKHPSMIRTLNNLGIEWNFLNLIKKKKSVCFLCGKHIENIIANSKKKKKSMFSL